MIQKRKTRVLEEKGEGKLLEDPFNTGEIEMNSFSLLLPHQRKLVIHLAQAEVETIV